jgi:hypothetical protein
MRNKNESGRDGLRSEQDRRSDFHEGTGAGTGHPGRRALAEEHQANCAGQVAQEFGDHPKTTVMGMRRTRGAAREAFADPGGGRGRLMEEGMIQAQAMAARVACAVMTVAYLTEFKGSVERACGLRGRSQWGRKAAAHAEIFGLLAKAVDDPLLSCLLAGSAAYALEMMLVVGRAADGMIVSSRRRLLAYLRAGDGDAAALELERHLRSLLYMGRLAQAAESER